MSHPAVAAAPFISCLGCGADGAPTRRDPAMRRTTFALALLLAAGWAAPSQAQGWGGWGRPCFGPCGPWPGGGGWARPGGVVVLGFAPRPRPFWAGPGGYGPPRFRPAGWGWGWRRWAWRREMRWRRLEAWRRWDAASRQAAHPEQDGPRVRRWARRADPYRPAEPVAILPEPVRARPEPVRPTAVAAPRPAPEERRAPARADTAVALMPTGSLHLARPRPPAAVPSRVLAAAAMLRRPAPAPRPVVPAILRAPEPPLRPAERRPAPALLRPPAAPTRALRPAALRIEPAPSAQPTPAALPVAAPPPPAVAPADVPVAPLD